MTERLLGRRRALTPSAPVLALTLTVIAAGVGTAVEPNGDCEPRLGPVAQPTIGLVSWWAGDGDACDLGVGNDGETVGDVLYEPTTAGQAFSFSGAGDHVRVGNPASLRITGSLTLAAWVRPEPLYAGQWMAIIDKWGQTIPNDSYAIFLVEAGGTVRLLGAIGDGATADFGFAGGSIVSDVWHHVAMTYDASTGDNVLYVNGIEVAARDRSGGVRDGQSPLLVGREYSTPCRPFDGLVDDAMVFARSLTAVETVGLYAAGVTDHTDSPA